MSDQEKLQAAIREMAEDLGLPTPKFEPEEDLQNYIMGEPLLYRDFLKLPEGSVVWATYQEYGEESFRANGPYKTSPHISGQGYVLSDGSIGGLDFEQYDNTGTWCFDNCCGQGELYLYHAVRLAGEGLSVDDTIHEIETILNIDPEGPEGLGHYKGRVVITQEVLVRLLFWAGTYPDGAKRLAQVIHGKVLEG